MKMMRRCLLCFLSIVLVLETAVSFTAADSAKASETVRLGENMDLNAGAALILDADITKEDEALTSYAVELNGGETAPAVEEGPEQESTLVMVNVDSMLNVRADANTEAEIVGVLYANCGGQILERQNGWTKLQSGNLIGWASDEYLLFETEAEALAYEVGDNHATILTDGLKVRKEPSSDAEIYGLLKKGEVVSVYERLDGWFRIGYDKHEGYISDEYAEMIFRVDEGETTEEIEAREAAEAEAAAQAKASAEARRAAMQEEKVYVANNYSDAQILAAIIWCEAGNQGYEGQLAVGAVIMNRVNSSRYPNTIADVVYAPGQFTPTMYGKVLKALEKGSYASCLQAAQDAINGVNNVGTATHFNRADVRSSDLIIGAHAFW